VLAQGTGGARTTGLPCAEADAEIGLPWKIAKRAFDGAQCRKKFNSAGSREPLLR
jgi:hypothetical protein